MDPHTQSLPLPAELTQREYSVREWVMFYKNTWLRTLAARTIDVQFDLTLIAEKGEEEKVPFAAEVGVIEITVKERLQERKKLVKDALDCLKAIDTVLAMGDEEVSQKLWA